MKMVALKSSLKLRGKERRQKGRDNEDDRDSEMNRFFFERARHPAAKDNRYWFRPVPKKFTTESLILAQDER